jgi:primosomal protein N'
MAALVGAAGDIAEVAAALAVPHSLLGPVPDPVRGDEDRQRGLVVVDRQHGPELSRQLRAVTATRSARAKDRPVHVRIDPRDI